MENDRSASATNRNDAPAKNADENTNSGDATAPTLVPPIDEFFGRITKKRFGTYVTPADSPVQPERFTGYHTAVDVEYGDRPGENIPVVAIADGEVVLARRASGYGGVAAILHEINGEPLVAVYGHLKIVSMPSAGQQVGKGEQIGLLGEGGSSDTDGERKHLHFGIVKGTSANLLGYV